MGKPVSLHPLSFEEALASTLTVTPETRRRASVDSENFWAFLVQRGGSTVYVADDGRRMVRLPPNGGPFPLRNDLQTDDEIIDYILEMRPDLLEHYRLDFGDPAPDAL